MNDEVWGDGDVGVWEESGSEGGAESAEGSWGESGGGRFGALSEGDVDWSEVCGERVMEEE